MKPVKQIFASALAVAAFASFADTRIAVGAGRGREVSDYIFGVNHRYAQAGYGMFDPKTGKVKPDFLKKTKGAAGAVRWPGGTIANRTPKLAHGTASEMVPSGIMTFKRKARKR